MDMTDITKAFTEASDALGEGELVKDADFTLFESVGALEIMDPKMDSGFLQPGETLYDNFNVSAPLTAEQVVWVMDELFCYEMAWHKGYALLETLYTSVHLDNLLHQELSRARKARKATKSNKSAKDVSIDDVCFRAECETDQAGTEPTQIMLIHLVLRAYCLGLLKCCDLTIRIITSQMYHEEEDFVSQTFNRDLLSEHDTQEIYGFIQSAYRWLGSTGASSIPDKVRAALKDRLFIRQDFLGALEATIPDSNAWRPNRFGAWRDLQRFASDVGSQQQIGQPVLAAFSEKIQRRFSSNTPPRPIFKLTYREAHRDFDHMLESIGEACQLYELPKTSDCALSLLRYVWAFADKSPATLPRAIMQTVLFTEGQVCGRLDFPFERLLRIDLRELVLAGHPLISKSTIDAETSSDPGFRLRQLLDDFIKAAYEPYFKMYEALCQNRCRIRRRLTHIIGEFDSLQDEAKLIDRKVHTITTPESSQGRWPETDSNYPLHSWVSHHKHAMTQWVLQLGFEHDIYEPNELGIMYSVLSQVQAAQLDSNLRIGHFAKLRYTSVPDVDSYERVICGISCELNTVLGREFAVTSSLTGLLKTLYGFLDSLGTLSASSRRYGSAQRRFELRMKALQGCTSETFDFDTLNNGLRPDRGLVDDNFQNWNAVIESTLKELQEVHENISDQPVFRSSKEQWKKQDQLLLETVRQISERFRFLREACKDAGITMIGEGSLKGKVDVIIPPPGTHRIHDWWVVPEVIFTRAVNDVQDHKHSS
ncbi:hypothetical protein LTR28_004618 [Elasticomyces elasticus]|nr:hypothetical protein LTR28_004618 [Elasticomyces elasticus]